MSDKPKLKRDWVGRKVRLQIEVTTRGGNHFPAGTVMTVTRNFGGLHLEYLGACEQCRLLHFHRVKGIPEGMVILVDETAQEKRDG